MEYPSSVTFFIRLSNETNNKRLSRLSLFFKSQSAQPNYMFMQMIFFRLPFPGSPAGLIDRQHILFIQKSCGSFGTAGAHVTFMGHDRKVFIRCFDTKLS